MLMMSLLSVFSNKANWRVLSVMQTTHCLYFHNWLFDLVLNNYIWWASQVVLVVKNPPVDAGDIRDAGSTPLWGRSPGGGHDNPLQYSCLENPMERGAWWATVHGVAKSRTRLKWLSMCVFLHVYVVANAFVLTNESSHFYKIPFINSLVRLVFLNIQWSKGRLL